MTHGAWSGGLGDVTMISQVSYGQGSLMQAGYKQEEQMEIRISMYL